ncbi:uncharacterized protein LTR77_001253 [Saxophila tyrrhenica]|uniref:Uncharacterized protein n=1 Tax=Saxophila tyrrhenica TaxID=1690608 RepID=A0AAV9PMA7_9PEZI|nr:hypothetical protein LTR77_001253 [Saxophila tyrrhenica]
MTLWTATWSRFCSRQRTSPYRRAETSYSQPDFYIVTSNMGKSNKFDYSNRANSGLKLGQIVGGALQKEAEKVKKDAERHLQKARKQSLDSLGGDIDTTRHIIDLKAPNKDLGDEGVCALADGLEDALRNSSTVASLALEDLNLSGNGITTVTLARLAPIIELSVFDLKTLNLADNKIKVETDDQAEQWEVFLKAFRHCFKLRRIDLSSNTGLSSRALEILARVHISEDWIDPVNPGGESSVLSLASHAGDDDNDTPSEVSPQLEYGSIPPSDMSNARILKRRCGLRSVPCLTLHDIGLDDAGALWLSYVLQDHHYPNQLMDELNATHAESAIKTYQQGTSSKGIDWTDNKSAGKEGLQLLEKTETLRQQIMLDGDTARTRTTIQLHQRNRQHGEDHSSGQSGQRRTSGAAPGDRRVSMRSIRTNDGGEHDPTELQSARSRIQRHIISQGNVHAVELWKAALRIFRTSRMLLFIAPDIRSYLPDSDMPTNAIGSGEDEAPPADSPIAQSPSRLTLDTAAANKPSANGRVSCASKAGRQESSELAIADATNRPTSPLKLQKSTTRKGASGDVGAATKKLSKLATKASRQGDFLRYQRRRAQEARRDGRAFRDTNAACHLPADVVERIVRLTMTSREVDVLSAAQKAEAIMRGQRRDTLTAEREWLKKDESAQVWMLLDSLDCLSYGE